MSFGQADPLVDPNFPVSPAVQMPADVPVNGVPQMDAAGNLIGWYAANADGTTTTWDAAGLNPVTTGPSTAAAGTAVSLGTVPLSGQPVPLAMAKGQALFASGPVSAYQAGNALSVLFVSIPSIGAFVASVPRGQQIGTIQDFIQMPDGSQWWYLYVGNAWSYASLNPLQSPYIYVPYDATLTYSGGTPLGVVPGATAGAAQTLLGLLGGLGVSPAMLWVFGGLALLVVAGPEMLVAGGTLATRAPKRRRKNPRRPWPICGLQYAGGRCDRPRGHAGPHSGHA